MQRKRENEKTKQRPNRVRTKSKYEHGSKTWSATKNKEGKQRSKRQTRQHRKEERQ
jgi:hypothetical protein